MEIGAALYDMDKVQIHPTSFVDPAKPTAVSKILGPEALRAYGWLVSWLVGLCGLELARNHGDHHGRFCNDWSFVVPINSVILFEIGGILLNRAGKRFVNELGPRDAVSEAIFKNGFILESKDATDPSGNDYVLCLLCNLYHPFTSAPPAD